MKLTSQSAYWPRNKGNKYRGGCALDPTPIEVYHIGNGSIFTNENIPHGLVNFFDWKTTHGVIQVHYRSPKSQDNRQQTPETNQRKFHLAFMQEDSHTRHQLEPNPPTVFKGIGCGAEQVTLMFLCEITLILKEPLEDCHHQLSSYLLIEHAYHHDSDQESNHRYIIMHDMFTEDKH